MKYLNILELLYFIIMVFWSKQKCCEKKRCALPPFIPGQRSQNDDKIQQLKDIEVFHNILFLEHLGQT